ncbi:sporulation-control protein [Paenibacillus sp. UNCCL117]|uniref:sporulation protein n=1 Tax=unclassified Paenibacillus TaxID=185978 RepID=UPI00088FF3E4|nr:MULTISPECIES: sporulation protein [unclassified Paenibacillus]SDD15384.1 sporulation-control protein [Paenibacillus sp. cl123]SFW34439.1 sporulation-control protein [Paenibacillus sp. UNCCL117]
MSFFKKMLASVGIGSAKVDTELDSAQVVVDGTISGRVRVQGGQTEQRVENIYLYLKTSYVREHNDSKVTHEAVIAKYQLSAAFTLNPGENKEIPFHFALPQQMPITLRQAPVWVETGLDISQAVDPTDRDYIQVLPNQEIQTVLDALDNLGFRLREVTNDYAPRLGGALPFVQEFEFVPTTHFRGKLDELEVLFFPRGADLELMLQIDRKARGLRGLFAEEMGLDESLVRVTIPGGELRRGVQTVAGQLKELISRYS